MTRDNLLALVRRILSPSGLTSAERHQLIVRLQAEARDPSIVECLFRYDVLLSPDEVVDLVLASQSSRLPVPSLN